MPVDPLPTITAQPAVPALGTDLPMSEGRLGNGGFQLVHPVPAGWSRISSSTNEVKWKKPGNPAETYVLRVGRLVSREETLPEMVEDRIDDLREEKARFAIEQRTANSLEFTYVSDGFLRHGFLVWLDVRASGFADVEIAVNGRGIDAPGAEQLITRVACGMRAGLSLRRRRSRRSRAPAWRCRGPLPAPAPTAAGRPSPARPAPP